jgi:hypothetical protein
MAILTVGTGALLLGKDLIGSSCGEIDGLRRASADDLRVLEPWMVAMGRHET